MGSSSRAPLDLDFRSPDKRARKNSGAADRSPAVGPPAGPQTSPLAPAHERQQQAAPPQDLAEQGLQEAGGSNEGTLAAAAAAGGEATVTGALLLLLLLLLLRGSGRATVFSGPNEGAASLPQLPLALPIAIPAHPNHPTLALPPPPSPYTLLPADAATAFRELRVRPARNASPGPHRSGAGGAAATAAAPGGAAAAAQLHVPERPPSPKKRKASYNIDKEFILKDDKVKRNTGGCCAGCCGAGAACGGSAGRSKRGRASASCHARARARPLAPQTRRATSARRGASWASCCLSFRRLSSTRTCWMPSAAPSPRRGAAAPPGPARPRPAASTAPPLSWQWRMPRSCCRHS